VRPCVVVDLLGPQFFELFCPEAEAALPRNCRPERQSAYNIASTFSSLRISRLPTAHPQDFTLNASAAYRLL
jgi:hypothetical protein